MLVISTTNKYYMLWKFFEVNLSIFSSLIYAYFAAYRVDVENGGTKNHFISDDDIKRMNRS